MWGGGGFDGCTFRVGGPVGFCALTGLVTACGGSAPPGETTKPTLDPTKPVPAMSREVTYVLEFEDDGPSPTETDPWASTWSALSVALLLDDDVPRSFRAWCVDRQHYISDQIVQRGFLYSSYEPLPDQSAIVHPDNLDALNFLINAHPIGTTIALAADQPEVEITYFDLQDAIWELVSRVPMSQDVPPNQALVSALVADALAHGEGFIPGPGARGALILVSQENFNDKEDIQTLALSTLVPGEYVPVIPPEAGPVAPDPL